MKTADVPEGKNITVTGGAGFIGSWIAEALCEKNSVKVLDDFSSGKTENVGHMRGDVKVIKGDIRKADLVSKALEDSHAVFHQAANVQIPASIKDPLMDAEINVTGTLNVLEACRRHDVKRLVFSSSSAVYGEPESLPLSEDSRLNPKSPYALSKLTGDQYVRLYNDLYGIKTVSLRYFNVYGRRQNADSPYSGVISIFIRNIREGKALTVFGDGEQTRDFVNVRDVVNANLLSLGSKNATGKAINIGTGTSVSLNVMIGMLEKISGRKMKVVYGKEREGDIKHSKADITLARKVLGYEPAVGLEQGLGELVESL